MKVILALMAMSLVNCATGPTTAGEMPAWKRGLKAVLVGTQSTIDNIQANRSTSNYDVSLDFRCMQECQDAKYADSYCKRTCTKH